MSFILGLLTGVLIYLSYVLVFLLTGMYSLHKNIGQDLEHPTKEDDKRYNAYIRKFPFIPSTIIEDVTFDESIFR